MENDRKESLRKKRKASLRLVDPRHDVKASRPSAKGSTMAAMMPPLAVPGAAKRVPSPPRAAEVAAAKSGEACQEFSVDDYLIGDIALFDA
jgi:hypothetical protein